MMFAARELAVLLSVCLLLSSTGCISSIRWAEKAHERVAPGMTENEVRDEIGDPQQVVRGDAGQSQIWVYQFESGPSVAATILLAVLLIGLLVLLLFSKGGGGGGVHGGGGDDPLAEFRVHFDAGGRVNELSPIMVVPRP